MKPSFYEMSAQVQQRSPWTQQGATDQMSLLWTSVTLVTGENRSLSINNCKTLKTRSYAVRWRDWGELPSHLIYLITKHHLMTNLLTYITVLENYCYNGVCGSKQTVYVPFNILYRYQVWANWDHKFDTYPGSKIELYARQHCYHLKLIILSL